MKIERLYTLNQFIEKLKDDGTLNNAEKFDLVIEYNEFLKQPLKIEMFVCGIEKLNIEEFKDRHFCPTGKCKAYFDYVNEYEEAQNKVIFKDKYSLSPSNEIIMIDINESEYYFHIGIDSLHNIAEATNGQLKLKL